MIFFIHGENTVKSREYIYKLKQGIKTNNKIEVDLNATSANELNNILTSSDLFNKTKFVILHVQKNDLKKIEEYLKVLEKKPNDTTIAILYEQNVPKNSKLYKWVSKHPKTKIILNDIEHNSSIFSFVDALLNKNKKEAYKQLTKLLNEDTDEFYIFSMITYGVRNVTHAKLQTQSYSKMNPYVKSKVSKQVKNFSLQELKDIYSLLEDIDYNIKSSNTNMHAAIPYIIEKMIV